MRSPKMFMLLISALLSAGLSSSPANAAHPYFLAATIDDPATIASVCKSQKLITNATSQVMPSATQDLHVSLVVLKQDNLNNQEITELHNLIAKVLNRKLKDKRPIKLATVIKSGEFAVYNKGFVVYNLEKLSILKTIADASRSAVVAANKPGITVDPRDDFNDASRHPHISFGTFDENGKVGKKKTSAFLRGTFASPSKAEMGQIIIESPNATPDWVLYEIDLKHNEGGHYVNVDSWILPKPGPPHHTPPSCAP